MKYQVKVDGKVYEVEVEKVSGGHKSLSMSDFGAAKMAPAQPVAAPVQSAPVAPVETKKVEEVKEAPKASLGAQSVISPMPGTILKVNVADGSKVSSGDVILILEAMKMENEIVAPCDGTVSIKVKQGETVDTDALLAEVK